MSAVDRAQIIAERDAQIIAWLGKKAAEYGTSNRESRAKAEAVGRMADKLSRGAVRDDETGVSELYRLKAENNQLRARVAELETAVPTSLPERLAAVLTERFTELGNPFSEMRARFKGPDGWPASNPVGPNAVAEVLRELLNAPKSARQAEDPHDSVLHHDYALGRDLPTIPHQQDRRAL